jgi:hypothetical protein
MRQGDHEHLAFEKFAEANGLDREMHPLHLLYLNSDTGKALDIFKEGYSASKLNAPDERFSKSFMEAVEEFYEEWKVDNNAKLPDFEEALIRAKTEGVAPQL